MPPTINIVFLLEDDMKAKTLTLALGLCFVAAIVGWASVPQTSDANVGTWKLNQAKSKFVPGATKNTMVVYEVAGDNVKVTVNGTDNSGNAVHHEWTGKFDGNDYPVTGDPASDMRSYKKVSDRTLALTAKKDGKVTLTGKIELSADGKTRTVTTTGMDAKGKKVKNVAVYDKQ
jgi:hypothetical protein